MNKAYGGWSVNIDHLFFANGRRALYYHSLRASSRLTCNLGDPWLEATVSAGSSPYMASAARPVGVSDGFHCSDLFTSNGYYDSTVAAVQRQGLAAIKTWVAAFRPTVVEEVGLNVRFERE